MSKLSEMISCTFTKDQKNELMKIAANDGRSLSSLIRKITVEYLQNFQG